LVCAFHKEANNIDSNPEHSFIAPGSKALLYTILLAHTKADVFIPSPAWVSYRPQVDLTGHNLINVECSYDERWRINEQNLNKAIHKKRHKDSILSLNYPANPEGLTYTADELTLISNVCRENEILVISDEIYALLSFEAHVSMATIYPEGTITTTGLSKWCGAGGWRLGVALLPNEIDPDFIKAMKGIASETYSCAATPIQQAAKTAYRSFSETQDYCNWQTEILQKISEHCYEVLSKAGLQLHAGQGGFYLFPGFGNFADALAMKGIRNSAALCEILLKETGVALLPGSAFGMRIEHLTVRLAYVDFDPVSPETEFDVKKHAPHVVAGVQKTASWLKTL